MALNAPNVNDISQFTQLRASARAQDPAALKAAAKQFEAMFTKQLLKSAHDAKLGDDLMGGDQGEFYQDMFDNQIAQTMAQGRGLGIADLLVRQLQQSKMAPADSGAASTSWNVKKGTSSKRNSSKAMSALARAIAMASEP